MFKDKVVVITGGSSGLGKELALRLVKRGAHITLVARDEKKLSTVKEELLAMAAPGQKVEAFGCDVADAGAVEACFQVVAEALGSPDVLINSAGILYEDYFEDHSLESFRRVMDVNYFGTVHCIKAALPFFKDRGGGRIVNVCSTGGLLGAFGYAAYCSSKFAVHGLTEVLRAELKPQGVVFHLVCPPEFTGPMVDGIEEGRTPENRALVHTVPVQSPEQVADETMTGIEAGRYLIVTGWATMMVELTNRWAPGLARTVVDARLKKIYKGPGS